jgi:hypothetical protein
VEKLTRSRRCKTVAVDPKITIKECHNADAGFRSASTLTLRTARPISPPFGI